MSERLSDREDRAPVREGDRSGPPQVALGAPVLRPPLNLLERISLWLAAACCTLIASLAAADIVLRPLRVEFFWASEGVGILMAWTVFLALPAVTRQESHISLEFIGSIVGPRLLRALQIAGYLLMLVYIAVIAWFCARMAWNSYVTDLRSASILRLPVVYSQLGVVIGLVILSITQCMMLVRAMMRRGGPVAHPMGYS